MDYPVIGPKKRLQNWIHKEFCCYTVSLSAVKSKHDRMQIFYAVHAGFLTFVIVTYFIKDDESLS